MKLLQETTTGRFVPEGWIETFTGRKVFPLAMTPDQVDLFDIAHSLSLTCRYNGHSAFFYSVAEHSVHVARLASPANALWGLLHDAAEAYLPDVASPIKPSIPGFAEMEEQVMRAVAGHFGLSWPQPSEVKAIDTAMLLTEAKALLPSQGKSWKWTAYVQSAPVDLQLWSPADAKDRFLETYAALRAGEETLRAGEETLRTGEEIA